MASRACMFALGRLLFILREVRAGRYPNATSMAERLEVSSKTIQRDFDALRYYFHAPLEYDPTERGYRLTDTAWRLDG